MLSALRSSSTMSSTLGEAGEPGGNRSSARRSAEFTYAESRPATRKRPAAITGNVARAIRRSRGKPAISQGVPQAIIPPAIASLAVMSSPSTLWRALSASRPVVRAQTSLSTRAGRFFPRKANSAPQPPKKSASAAGIIHTKCRLVLSEAREIRSIKPRWASTKASSTSPAMMPNQSITRNRSIAPRFEEVFEGSRRSSCLKSRFRTSPPRLVPWPRAF